MIVSHERLTTSILYDELRRVVLLDATLVNVEHDARKSVVACDILESTRAHAVPTALRVATAF